jgi:hypothetical protein
MKKADITKATSKHDTCAIFEVQTGDRGMKQYARLMTEEEKQQQQQQTGRVVYCSSKSAPKVTIVYVNAIGNDGKTSNAPCAYTEIVATNFVDVLVTRWVGGGKEKQFATVPLARIKRCVNETQSFADFFNAEVTAMKDAGKRAKQAEENRKQLAINHQNRITELNVAVNELVFKSNSVSQARSYGFGASYDEVTISIDALTKLVRLAEEARMNQKVGA